MVRYGFRDDDGVVSESVLPWRAFKVISWLAVAGAACTAAVTAWLLLPGDRPLPGPVWTAAFTGAVPVFVAEVVLAKRYWSRGAALGGPTLPAARQPGRPPTVVRVLFAVLVTLIVVILVLVVIASNASPVPPGSPEIVDGQYVLNNHGSLTPVSQREYMHVLEVWEMGFTSIAMVFYLAAALAVLMTGERLRERTEHVSGGSRSRGKSTPPGQIARDWND